MPRTAAIGLALCIVAFWMLQHPYEGIVHDSILYSLSALARLHPQSLGHDLFLSVGSQDRFTIFSPIAAAFVRLLGLEHAEAAITLISQVAFLICGWLLARRLMPSSIALLSVALLATLPATYGAKHVFSYLEAFMTPRLGAEALTLGALAAALGGRYVAAGACLLAGFLVHPLMAAAGAMMLFVLYVGIPRPKLALALVAAGLGGLILLATLMPFGPVARFSDGWFHLLYGRGQYLFPTQWPREDFTHALVPLAVLAVAVLTSGQRLIRSVAAAALIIGLGGLVLSILGADLLRIVLMAQLQPWRWLWLTNAMAVILTPLVLQDCWRAGTAGRAGGVLVVAAWVCIDENFAPVVALLAIGATAGARYVKNPGHARLMLIAACVVLVMSLAVLVGFVQGVLKAMSAVRADPVMYDSPYLLALRQWRPWLSGGVLAAALIAGLWWLTTQRKGRWSQLAVFGLGIALSAAAAPLAWNAWTRIDIPDRIYQKFAGWRHEIPPDSQVLWMQSPLPVWILLERPSYWSHDQTAASVYSEEMARELTRREYILDNQTVTQDPRQDLIGICRNHPRLGYFVTPADMGPSPFAPVVIDSYLGAGQVRLYRCADFRG